MVCHILLKQFHIVDTPYIDLSLNTINTKSSAIGDCQFLTVVIIK